MDQNKITATQISNPKLMKNLAWWIKVICNLFICSFSLCAVTVCLSIYKPTQTTRDGQRTWILQLTWNQTFCLDFCTEWVTMTDSV